MTSKNISNKKTEDLVELQKNKTPSTDELLFHPEIQEMFEQIITLIRNDQKEDAIDMVLSLMDFSMDTWRNKVEVEPNKWIMMDRPVGIQFFLACITIIKRGIYPFNIWLTQIMQSWFGNCLRDGVISNETYEKFLRGIGR